MTMKLYTLLYKKHRTHSGGWGLQQVMGPLQLPLVVVSQRLHILKELLVNIFKIWRLPRNSKLVQVRWNSEEILKSRFQMF